jgi:hypothetical protein
VCPSTAGTQGVRFTFPRHGATVPKPDAALERLV